jgi:chemotaxis signal transduction protein
MRVLVFRINADHYAVPMDIVHQVLRRPQVTSVPLAPPGLLGVLNVRGEIVPLFDTGILTGSGALGDPPFAVLVSGNKDLLALAALELPMAAEFDQPVAPGARAGELGVYSQGGRLVALIDIEALVSNQLDLSRAS